MTTPREVVAERPSKRRAPMSCDRCKGRKTKCVDPVPGPCQYCASIGAPCHLDPSRRRQRPYYHVSEEEFRCMTKVLEHFLPGTELNLQTLKEVAESFQEVKTEQRTTPHGEASSSNGGEAQSEPSPGQASTVTIEEIDELHGELGWLTVDSRGTYRHVGADSGYGFNAAVRSIKHRRRSEASNTDVILPLTAAPPLPLQTPETAAPQQPQQIFLPRHDLCTRCIARFFSDVHSIYWFFSAERFYATLDRIYTGDGTAASSSMLCALYSILAITCESEASTHLTEASSPSGSKYLSLAKALVPVLYDEADVDSIRALCLLALACQSSMSSNTAYIYIGSAARIAFTLGWHKQKSIESRSSLQRQVDLRVFGTLFLLDLDVALCYGNPPSMSDESTMGTLQEISEQILSPGTNMPLDYISVSCKLGHIKRRIGRLLYNKVKPTDADANASSSPSSGTTSVNAISDCLTSLQTWYDSTPRHLRDAAQAASYHQRSVAVLHLRYWSATIFATRPFLLYSVIHAAELADSPKRTYFEEFGARCIEAAAASLALLVFMREADLLSSLVTFDTGCVLEDLQVFLLAVAKGRTNRADDVRTCLHVLQGMEQCFWAKHVLAEVMAELEENGLLNGDQGFSPGGDTMTPGHFFLDIAREHEMIPGMMDPYLPDLQDPFFALPDTPMIADGLFGTSAHPTGDNLII